METAWIGAQKKVFTRWANTHLVQRGLKISDIDNDLRTGSILISLVEILSGEAKNSALREGPIEGKIQKMGNAAKALKYIESKGINLVNCRPEHIVDNNTKMVLGLLWRIITKYHIQPHLTEEELVHESGGNSNLSRSQKLGHFLNKTTRDALLRWCRTEVEAHNIALANFTKSFQNTAVLAALVHRLRADLLNLEEIANMEPKAAFIKIFSVAESGLQIPHLLDPEDLLDGHADECSVMAYVAYFLNYKRGASVIATPDVAVAVAEASTSQSSASASASASAQSNDLVIENAKLKANNDSFREHIKRELESIYQTVETHVSEITTATDTKINSVARKMLKLENTISKLSDLAESAKQSLLEQEDEKGKATAEVEKEWEAIRKEKEELAKERAQIEKEREELAKAREAFTNEQEQAKHDKEKKRERKNRVTVELPAEQPTPVHVHKPAEDTHVELPEELDISTDDLNSAAEALRSSVEEPVEEKTEISTESQPPVPAPVPEPEPEKPQAEPEKIEPQMPEKEMEDITDSKKIVLVQSFVRRWRDRRNYRFAKRRRDVVLEIVNTEKNYIHCLQMMTQEYFQPLRDIAKDKNLPLSHTLNENMLKTIFSNVEVILNINTILLKKLQQRWDSWHYQQKIGDVFLSMIEFLKCYNQYVNHYNRSLDALAEAAKSPAFVDFIKAKSIKNGKELRDLLIVPIQRIPRYVILLEEARKSTERTHPDYTDLSSSVTKMQSIADYVNEKKRDYEALAQVTAVQEMLVGISILEYTRLRYISEGELSAVLDDGKKTAQVHVFLFNELFICCKQVKKVFGDRKQNKPKYKFKNMITFTVDTKVEPKFDSMFVIEANQERHQFITKNNDRDVWVKHMKDNIEKLIEGKKTKVDRASKSLG